MTSEPFCCPYCNAYLTIPPATELGQRVPCPRCGEMVRVTSGPNRTASREPMAEARPSPAPSAPLTPARWSNRAVAGMIIAIMAALAIIALVYALETVSVRRGHDLMKPPRSEFITVPLVLRVALGVYLFVLALVLGRSYFEHQRGGARPRRFILPTLLTAVGAILVVLLLQPRRNPEPEPTELIPVRPVPPAELSGLGYLPDNVNLIAGIHLAEVLQNPTGQALLSGRHLRPLDLGLESLEELTQLKREEIDHVVAGLQATNEVPPPLTLVVRTRRPYDEPKILVTHPQQWAPPATDKPLHGIELKVGRLKVLAALWCADARTLVAFVNVKAEDIKRVPAVPPSGSERLAAPLRDFLRQRMSEGVQAWVVGDPQSWDKSALWHPSNWDNLADLLSVGGPKQHLAGLPLQALTKEERRLAQQVRTFGAWMRLEDGMDWHAAFDCGAPGVAQALEARLQQRTEEAKLQPATLVKENWVSIEGRVGVERLHESLGGSK